MASQSHPVIVPTRPSFRTSHMPSSPALTPAQTTLRSSSATRITDLGWAPSPSVPLALEATEHHSVKESYRAWRQNSIAAQQASRGGSPAAKKSVASGGKRKEKALAFVVGAPSSGSGDEGDVEAATMGAPSVRGRGSVSEDDDDGSPGPSHKELSVEEIIRWQIRQPVQIVDSQDLDSLLHFGVSDYTFILHPVRPCPPVPATTSLSTPTSPTNPASSTSPTTPSTPASPNSPATSVHSLSKEGPSPAILSESVPPNRVSLGKGKFSEVLLVRKGHTDYALKHTPLHPHHPLIATRLLREPTILAQLLPHPNLVKVYETIRTPGHFYLVEENLADSITLEALVASSEGGVLPPVLAWSVLDQLASVVRSLHEPLRVCHRDIKPENILVHVTPSEDPAQPPKLLLKLLDFGLATHYSGSEAKLTTCCGSPAYHSPELWRSLREPSGTVKYWGPEVDIWCLGLTLLRCLTPNKYPLGIAHSSLFALSDKVVDALLAVPDEPIRRVLAPLMQMDGEKRMRAFEKFCESRPSAILPPEEGKKEFKSTTFLPTERTHSLDLQLSPTVAHPPLSRSPSRSRLRDYRFLPDLPTTAVAELSRPGGTPEMEQVSSPALTPDRSSTATASFPSTPRAYSRERQAHPPPVELVLLNPTDEPIRRAASYIKYALRCAGILYHVRDNLFDSAFSAVATPLDGPDIENDSAFVCLLQCVIKLPNTEHQSRASSALIAALRPPLTRAHTTGNPVRSSSTPPTGKAAQRKKEEIKALTFFLSIRKAEVDADDSPQQQQQHYHRARNDSQSRKPRPGKRRNGSRIVVALSDPRALPAVREALKVDEPESPVPTSAELEERRGRTGPATQGQPKPVRLGSGSREARTRRTRHVSVASESIPEVAPGEGLGLTMPSEKKAAGGFFDFVSKLPGMASKQNNTYDPSSSEATTPTSLPSEEDRERQERVRTAREQAMAAVAF